MLHVHEWGDPEAPPVVCLHGITGHGRRFRQLAEARLASRFHVLAPDLLGHGLSDWEPPWSIKAHLDGCTTCLGAFDFEVELRQVIVCRVQDRVPEALRMRIARLMESEED